MDSHIEDRSGVKVLVMQRGSRPATPDEIAMWDEIERLHEAMQTAADLADGWCDAARDLLREAVAESSASPAR